MVLFGERCFLCVGVSERTENGGGVCIFCVSLGGLVSSSKKKERKKSGVECVPEFSAQAVGEVVVLVNLLHPPRCCKQLRELWGYLFFFIDGKRLFYPHFLFLSFLFIILLLLFFFFAFLKLL